MSFRQGDIFEWTWAITNSRYGPSHHQPRNFDTIKRTDILSQCSRRKEPANQIYKDANSAIRADISVLGNYVCDFCSGTIFKECPKIQFQSVFPNGSARVFQFRNTQASVKFRLCGISVGRIGSQISCACQDYRCKISINLERNMRENLLRFRLVESNKTGFLCLKNLDWEFAKKTYSGGLGW